jgi:serine/threonine protein kinase
VLRGKGPKKDAAETKPSEATTWGTEGFAGEQRRAEYGEIKKGDVLGGFRVDEMVGAGAMAVVYKATQLSLDRPVALKILPREFAHRESFVRQFDSETDLLASLNHPNIVNIIDRGRAGETYYFAMEFVEGTTLAELLASGQVDEEFFLQMMEQCAEALAYAHSKGIIHRDIKPANIMLNEQGMVKITDFGVAGLIAQGGADAGTKRRVMGTRGYMAPEQEISVTRADEKSDIFSLGAVMYRVLTNTVPDRLPCPPPSQLNARVDPRIDSLVLKCLDVNPQRRYESARDLLEAVRTYRRQVSRIQPVCPKCHKENPVTQKACLHCGADLSEMFDLCPECGAENRVDVDLCLSCGSNLNQIRQQASVRISKIEERARQLAGRRRYEEAIEQIRQILQVRGKVFQRARERAQRLIASYEQARADYAEERIRLGRSLAGEGKLTECLEVLQSVPTEFARQQGLAAFTRNIKSRMAVATRRLEGIPQLLKERRYDDADKVLDSVSRMWVGCPQSEEARKQLQMSRQNEQMLDYELAEVRRHLEKGETAQARQAIGFALSSMPDNPTVKELLAEIDRREKANLVKGALAEGKKAFDKGNYREAVRYWTTAGDALPADDKGRQKVLDNVAMAQQKRLEQGVVRLEPTEVIPLREAGGPGGSVKIVLTLLVAGAALVAGVVFLVVAR